MPFRICLVQTSFDIKSTHLRAVRTGPARCLSLSGAWSRQRGIATLKSTLECGVLRDTYEEIELYSPTAADGFDLNELVAASPPLDPNSVYCNLLQCTHFEGTSIGAKQTGKLVGFISGYRIPSRPNTLFVWQVVVAEPARGCGLATRMLNGLLSRPDCSGVEYLETTITEANQASWALFTRFAKQSGGTLSVSDGFDRETHFNGKHDSEKLLRIGPLTNNTQEECK